MSGQRVTLLTQDEAGGMAVLGEDGTVGGTKGSPLSSSVVTGSAVQWAAQPESLISGAITRDSNDAAIEAPVVWPDGDTGVYKATTVSTSFPGAVDAYTITKVKGETTKTYTQSAVTRDASGAVTNRPAISVA